MDHGYFQKLLSCLLCCSLLAGCTPASPVSQEGDSHREALYRALAMRNQEHETGSSVLHPAEGFSPREKKDTTLMVYMIGSNLESQFGNGTRDLEEMRKSQVDFGKNNVIVYTGGACRWSGRIPSGQNSLLDLSLPEENQIAASTEKNADMGVSETLAAFLNFTVENFPAQHYDLIFWDHGGGPILGYGSDELFGNDSLDLPELVYALDQTPFKNDLRLDFIGFDACLMGNLEWMSILNSYADYYVASQELEPGPGWNYAFLNTLNRTSDPEEITASIIDSFRDFYLDARTGTSDPDVTLSCISLEKISRLVRNLSHFADSVSNDLELGGYSFIRKARSQAKSFGASQRSGENGFQYDLCDLQDLILKLQPDRSEETDALLETIRDCVVYNYSNTENTCGISLYFPSRNKGQYSQHGEDYRYISPSPSYGRLVDQLACQWVSQKSRDWNLGSLYRDQDQLTLQLTKEQQDSILGAYYSVYHCSSDSGTYSPILRRVRVWPDPQGVIRIPGDPGIICLETDKDTATVWPAEQLSSGHSSATYHIGKTHLLTQPFDIYNNLGLYYEDRPPVSITLKHDFRKGDLKIQSVDADGAAVPGGKNTIDTSRYESISYIHLAHYPQRASNGSMLPYSEWTHMQEGTYVSSCLPLSGSFHFTMKPCSSLQDDFAVQLELEDLSGEFYATDLSPIETSPTYQMVSEETASGVLSYQVYEDYAALIGYEGEDETVLLPETVRGKPLEVIDSWAFSQTRVKKVSMPDSVHSLGCGAFCMSRLQEIQLSRNLREIGDLCFYSCRDLTSLSLPRNLRKLGQEALEQCTSLKSLDLPSSLEVAGSGCLKRTEGLRSLTMEGQPDGSAPGCVLKDGVLYTKDLKNLIAFPACSREHFQVPEGTESIGTGAFSCSSLKTVSLPASLKEIGNFAFQGTQNLEFPRLPQNLEAIGYHAFGSSLFQEIFKKGRDQVQTIAIGPRLRFLGAGAFDGIPCRRFEVSPQNPHFSTLDGNLCNGAGDSVIAYALDGTPAVVVPEGMREFRWDSLNFLDNFSFTASDYEGFELYLPSSVELFYGDPRNVIRENYLISVPENSTAMSIVQELGLPFRIGTYSPCEIFRQKTAAGELTYRLYKDYAMLVDYQGEDTSLALPQTVAGLPLKVIGSGLSSITADSVTHFAIPEGVEIINRNALQLWRLRWYRLPDSIRRIESHGCGDGWNWAVLPKLPAGLTYLGEEAITARCTGTLTIPEHLTHMEEGALAGLQRNLTRYETAPGNTAFKAMGGCLYDRSGTTLLAVPGKLADPVIQNGTEKIAAHAFENCTRMKKVEIPQSVTSIGDTAFEGCDQLQQADLPNELTYLGENAFRYCESLKQVHIPGTLQIVGECAFGGCSALESIEIEEGVQRLEYGNLAGGPDLKTLKLPDSLICIEGSLAGVHGKAPLTDKTLTLGKNLSKISMDTFQGLLVEDFSVDPENPVFGSSGGFLTSRDGSMLFACPAGRTGTVTIPEGVEYIRNYAFRGCDGVTDLVLPDSVRFIENPASVFESEFVGSELVYHITFHCSPGSYAESYAHRHNFPCITD